MLAWDGDDWSRHHPAQTVGAPPAGDGSSSDRRMRLSAPGRMRPGGQPAHARLPRIGTCADSSERRMRRSAGTDRRSNGIFDRPACAPPGLVRMRTSPTPSAFYKSCAPVATFACAPRHNLARTCAPAPTWLQTCAHRPDLTQAIRAWPRFGSSKRRSDIAPMYLHTQRPRAILTNKS